MPSKTLKLAHLHAQESQHDEAYMVANKDALLEIVYAICKAERTGDAVTARLMTTDGEGFDLIVVCENAPWADPKWQHAKLPYTKESAGVPAAPTVAPWDHPAVKRLPEPIEGVWNKALDTIHLVRRFQRERNWSDSTVIELLSKWFDDAGLWRAPAELLVRAVRDEEAAAGKP